MQRRELLNFASGLPLLGCISLKAGATTAVQAGIAWYPLAGVEDAELLVLADTAQCSFNGDGYYLYPAWGQPGLYRVEQKGGRLRFRAADSSVSYWQQTAEPDMFAGRVTELVPEPPGRELRAQYPALQVPALPRA